MSAKVRVPAGLRRRGRDEGGYVAATVVIMASTFLFGMAALGVDVARWWLEAQRVQAAADAAALGSVSFVPMDPSGADASVKDIARRNGYDDGKDGASVTLTGGAKASQLRVTVCGRVSNGFGAILGPDTTTVCRTALADYTGPAPMGSPCNTFGNEPDSGGGSAALPTGTARGSDPNCISSPQFWAVIAGPEDDKGNGDQYSTLTCSSASFDGCDTSKNNTDYNPSGYFWVVHVEAAAVNSTIDVQLYDPAYVPTGQCADLPAASAWGANPNPYVTTSDGPKRYGNVATDTGTTGAPFCSGDLSSSSTNKTVTSFALRQQVDNQQPDLAPVQNSTAGSPCIAQFAAGTAPTASSKPKASDTDALTSGTSSYNDNLAQTFHNWYSLCKFTPTRAGDYYLQVRTNVALGGTAATNTNGKSSIIYRGNTKTIAATGDRSVGEGRNVFGIRAVAPGKQDQISVSGYDRMPIYANADGAQSTFNLIRVLPAGASKAIQFNFFDVGDATGTGTVTVLPPTDATTTGNKQKMTSQSYSVQFPGGCPAKGGKAGTGATYTDCSAPIEGGTGGANNGHTETLVVPIPNDYLCDYSTLTGCWYRVKVAFSKGTVTDITTWSANITGDPVRLIQ